MFLNVDIRVTVAKEEGRGEGRGGNMGSDCHVYRLCGISKYSTWPSRQYFLLGDVFFRGAVGIPINSLQKRRAPCSVKHVPDMPSRKMGEGGGGFPPSLSLSLLPLSLSLSHFLPRKR